MIGITGVARSGKDTLYSLLARYFKYSKIDTARYALADLLKKDLSPFIKDKFNIDLSSIKPEEKELIRPLMVAYGKIKRNQTHGRYWIENLNNIILRAKDPKEIPIVTDIRYDEYPKDEFYWLKKENNGFLIHVSRVFEGKIIGPANEEEAKNNNSLISKADYHLIWCTENDPDLLYNEYNKNLKEIYENYRRHRLN